MLRFLLPLLLLFLSGCSWLPFIGEPEEPPAVTRETALAPVPWSEVEAGVFADIDLDDWAAALLESAAYYAKTKSDFQFGEARYDAKEMETASRDLAERAKTLSSPDLFDHLRNNYRLFKSIGGAESGAVLVTGYYEPLLHGAETPDARNRHPLYRRPDDLLKADLGAFSEELEGKSIFGRVEGNRFVPYHDRRAIEGGKALAGRGLELLWVDDPVEVFFLQIQGSGRVRLPDGGYRGVGYHAKNGRAYRSIGKLLIEEGAISKEEMSLPALKKWLTANPDQVDRILNANPSYVFFRPIEGGPFGNIQVALTPERSIATDHRLFPKGAPAFLVTEEPRFEGKNRVIGFKPAAFLAVNQDTGGAIRGAGRVDWFLGFGDRAEAAAGVMKQPGGALYFIAPLREGERSLLQKAGRWIGGQEKPESAEKESSGWFDWLPWTGETDEPEAPPTEDKKGGWFDWF